MKITIIDSPSTDLMLAIDRKIEEFNLSRWEVKEKRPVVLVMYDTSNEVIAGATEKAFGYKVQWTQAHYPKEGCKYFMVKELT